MDQETSVFSALRREPERAVLLLKLAVVTAVVLVAWDVMASWALPVIAVKAVLVLLVLAYGTVTTYVAGGIMSSTRGWAARSSATAEKLADGERRGIGLEALRRRPEELPPVEEEEEPAPFELVPDTQPPIDAATTFNESYFLMRLQEQVKDARRNGTEMCVAAVHVTVPSGEMTADVAESVAYEMARMAANQTRVMGQTLAMTDCEFVFSLPVTGPNETKQFVREIMRAFGDYWCYFGIAAFPRNATDATGLVERARAACETSLQSGKRGQVQYSAA